MRKVLYLSMKGVGLLSFSLSESFDLGVPQGAVAGLVLQGPGLMSQSEEDHQEGFGGKAMIGKQIPGMTIMKLQMVDQGSGHVVIECNEDPRQTISLLVESVALESFLSLRITVIGANGEAVEITVRCPRLLFGILCFVSEEVENLYFLL